MEHASKSGTAVAFDGVSFEYAPRGLVLDRVSFSLPPGSFTAIVGPSGSGKSTILKLLAGLAYPSEGKVICTGNVSMVFQSGALLPWKTVEENVEISLLQHKLSPRESLSRAHEALNEVGMRDLARELPRNLSGGQRQRVGIARALAVNPDVLLLDEPFSALDVETASRLHRELLSLWDRRKLTVILVSHSPEEAVLLAQSVMVLRAGRIVKTISVPFGYPRALDQRTLHLENEVRLLIRAH